MKNDEQYKALSDKIQLMMSGEGATVGAVYLDLTDHGEDISPQEFVSAFLVGQGMSLPETALLVNDFPAIEYIRHLDLEEQERYIRKEESFIFVVTTRSGFSTQMRTYKQLNELDCQQLFEKDSVNTSVHNVRILEKALTNPDRDYLIRVKL